MTTPDTSSSITWQKIAIIVAVVLVAVPAIAGFAWKVVFPQNYLVYATTPIIQTSNSLVGGITITNEGSAVQRDVVLDLTSQNADPKNTFIDISGPSNAPIDFILPSEPKTPLSKYSKGEGSEVPIGIINPGEEVLVTLKAVKPSEYFVYTLSLLDVHVQSSQMTAIKADGVRRPELNDDLHTFYMMVAPYFLALVAAMIIVIIGISIVHEAFFDTLERKMTRLWKQMDLLQEKHDKERRYK